MNSGNSKLFARRAVLLLFSAILVFGTFALAGPRSAAMLIEGLGFGCVLEGMRFGFTGPWRAIVTERDGRGLMAQLFAGP